MTVDITHVTETLNVFCLKKVLVQVMEATISNQWRIGLPNGVSAAFAGEVVDFRNYVLIIVMRSWRRDLQTRCKVSSG